MILSMRKFRHDTLVGELFTGASYALILRVIGVVLAFGLNLAIARLLGADASGTYFMAISLVIIGSVIARGGLDLVALRRLSASESQGDAPAVRGLVRRFVRLVGWASVALSLGLGLALWALADGLGLSPAEEATLLLAVAGIPAVSLTALFMESLKAFRAPGKATAIQSALPQALSLVMIVPLVTWFGLPGAGATFLLAMCVGAAVGYWLVLSRFSDGSGAVAVPALAPLLSEGRPLWVMMVINRGLLPWAIFPIIYFWGAPEEAGMLGVATRIAMLVSLPLLCVEAALAPRFSQYWVEGRLDQIEQLGRRFATISITATAPALLLVIFAPTAMGIFGVSFLPGATALAILVIGHILNAAFGSVNLALMMAGKGNEALKSSLWALLVLVALALLLVPSHGLNGAAVAVASALVTNRIAASIYLWRRCGIILLPFRGER